ncbi:hypothetical protein ACFL20_09890 [Spirochaetota bacterium]
MQKIYFNKRIDPKGRGWLLEVQMELENLSNEPIDLYVFVVATYEVSEGKKFSSFNRPIPPEERIKLFIPFPFDMKNFQYESKDVKGKPIKDDSGKIKIDLLKMPRNFKSGINPITGKIYRLNNKLEIRSYHLSKYRRVFYFFNEVAIIMFDKNGGLAFKQIYDLIGYRR